MKPLGTKAYGSIPHLPGSRLGSGDHHCAPGQAQIATEKVRDRHDAVYVEEKLDGSCCAVARLDDGRLVALGRSGYLAQSSPFEQHQLFANWVRRHTQRFEVLGAGERLVGEWLAQAHGTRYDLRGRSPFVAFDIMRGHTRVPRREFWDRVAANFAVPQLLFHGPCSIEKAIDLLDGRGHYGALEEVEGAVWRVERDGSVDFLCKYVRPDKVDGCYLPDVPGCEVWNWRPRGEKAA